MPVRKTKKQNVRMLPHKIKYVKTPLLNTPGVLNSLSKFRFRDHGWQNSHLHHEVHTTERNSDISKKTLH